MDGEKEAALAVVLTPNAVPAALVSAPGREPPQPEDSEEQLDIDLYMLVSGPHSSPQRMIFAQLFPTCSFVHLLLVSPAALLLVFRPGL